MLFDVHSFFNVTATTEIYTFVPPPSLHDALPISDNGSVAVVANSNGSLGTVGISGNEAMGRILAGGVRDMADWVNKLYGQAFAAVYVQPGARVAVHLEQPLDIDYDAQGRPEIGSAACRDRVGQYV